MKSAPKLRPASRWLRLVTTCLVLAVGLQSFAPSGLAGPISSPALSAVPTREADLASIQVALEHKVVQQRLQELGFTSTEIQQRLAQATDAELHQLATESEAMMAGGVAGLIISVLVIIILVVLIMRITAVDPVLSPDVMAA